MEYFVSLMTQIINFMKTPFTIWGYAFSLWGVFMLIMILSVVMWFIGEVFNG